MAGLLATLRTKASLPLLLTVYAGLVCAFGFQLPRLVDGSSWVVGSAPSSDFVAWCVAAAFLIVAIGIASLINQACSAIEQARAIAAPWCVRAAGWAVFVVYVIAYFGRDASPEMRLVLPCAIVAFLIWAIVWPAYVVRRYG